MIRIILENKLRIELQLPIFTAIAASKPREKRAWEERLRKAFSSQALFKAWPTISSRRRASPRGRGGEPQRIRGSLSKADDWRLPRFLNSWPTG